METAHQKGSTAPEASLRQDGAKHVLSGIFHQQEDVVSPVLWFLPDAMVLEHVTPSPRGYLGSHLGFTE